MWKNVAVLVALLGLLGCGDGKTLLLLALDGDAGGAQTIRVRPNLDEKPSTKVEDFSPRVREIGLLFEAEERGLLKLYIGGFDGNCLMSLVGPIPQVRLAGQPEIRMRAFLSRLVPPECS